MKKIITTGVALGLLLFLCLPLQAQRYKDPGAPVEERVADLLARMTLEEKIAQMNMHSLRNLKYDEKGEPFPESLDEVFGPDGIGFLESPFLDVDEVARAGCLADRYHREQTRLGIPPIQVAECLHGQLALGATIFPQAIAQGCTWNPDLIRQLAEAIAREASAGGADMALSPLFDLIRDPRFGRVEECYSEDPYLTGVMGSAFVVGMQGDPTVTRHGLPAGKLACTAKHFAGYSAPVAGINLAPSSIGEREMRDTHLPPFRMAVRDAGIYAVMPSYNEVDGVPAHANRWLLHQILREEWQFEGVVFSDYAGIMMLDHFHHTASSAKEAALQALQAGVDVEAPFPWGYAQLKELLDEGRVTEAMIDRAVSRILRIKFMMGLFEKPYIDPARVREAVRTPEHLKLAREVAEESIVLLKNEGGLLPLDPKRLKSIAVIGPNAHQVQFGDYSPTRSNQHGVTVLQGIREVAGKELQIRYAKGCDITGNDRSGFDEAILAASQSDLVILVMGGTSAVLSGIGWGEGEQPGDPATCGEGFDRHELDFPGVQPELIRAVAATGKPVVLVMVHGRPYAIAWEKAHLPAILETWYPGEEGGRAVANILFGITNPSGRLSMSIPQSVGHVPVYYSHKPSGRGYYRDPGSPEKPGHDYVFASTEPLFSFGYGLSYTTFRYDDLQVERDRYREGDTVRVTVTLTNTGSRHGKEVVQLYLNDKVSSTTTPVRRLVRFQKVALGKGESRRITFTLHRDDFTLWNRNMEEVVEPGEFEIMIGRSADDMVLSREITYGDS